MQQEIIRNYTEVNHFHLEDMKEDHEFWKKVVNTVTLQGLLLDWGSSGEGANVLDGDCYYEFKLGDWLVKLYFKSFVPDRIYVFEELPYELTDPDELEHE